MEKDTANFFLAVLSFCFFFSCYPYSIGLNPLICGQEWWCYGIRNSSILWLNIGLCPAEKDQDTNAIKKNGTWAYEKELGLDHPQRGSLERNRVPGVTDMKTVFT